MFLLNETDKLYNNFKDAVFADDALNNKTKYLIALACAVMADCVNCINSYFKKAVDAGASKNEISAMLAITMSVCAGSKKAKYSDLINGLMLEVK